MTTPNLGTGPVTESPNIGRRSRSGTTIPLRCTTPARARGIPGTGVTESTSNTSRICRKSMAKSSPDRLIRQTRVAVAPSVRSGEGITGNREAPARSLASAITMSCEAGIELADGALYGGEQGLRFEGLDHTLTRALPLAPEFVASIAVSGHE